MKEIMRFEREQFYFEHLETEEEEEKDITRGMLIRASDISTIKWMDGLIELVNDKETYYHIKNTPEIRDYLKEFGFYIDRETKE